MSSVCSFDDGSISHYTVILEDVENGLMMSHSALNTEVHCMNGICSTSITLVQFNGIYNLSIMAQNIFGSSNRAFFPFPIGKMIRPCVFFTK